VINAATTSSPQPQTQSQTQPQLNTTTTTSLPSLTPVSTIPSVAASVLPPPPAVDNWSASVIRNQENNNNNNGTPTQTNATLTKTTTNTSISSAVSRELTQSPNLEEKPRSQSILEDLIPNFEKLKKQIQKPLPLEDISKILENSLLNCPDSLDSEKPKTYQPSNPHPTSIYYPLEPTPELFYSAIIGKVDLSTLFYNFYYHQGEYVQLLSAKELVKKGWQYDVKSSKWYQKTEEIQPPSLVNDQIVNSDKRVIWKYFDNDGVWLPRRKDDFDINSVDLRSSF
jgi:CCR4-NOT transcription complex subunit 3